VETNVIYNEYRNTSSIDEVDLIMEMHLIGSMSNAFQSEEECEQFLMRSRWANGFSCPRCDHNSFYKVKTRSLLECKECRTQVSITAGTVMHKSKLPLLLWFKAIRILIQDELTYSIPAFANLLSVNYRTAKLVLEKIQLALHKQYARMGKLKTDELNDESLASNIEQLKSEEKIIRVKKNTSSLARFLFRTFRNVKYAEEDMFKKWMYACFSVFLYPHFLGYFQVA
jgi:transposase-like protein